MNLDTMGGNALRARFHEVTGKKTDSHNHPWLRRQITAALGGKPPPRAAKRLAKAAKMAVATQIAPKKKKAKADARPRLTARASTNTGKRDPRLPAVGATILREYKGKEFSVEVLADGFKFQGKTWPSLSAIATHLTGNKANGFLFFGL